MGYRLRPSKSVGPELRRAMCGEIDRALAAARDPQGDAEELVHSLRKRCKKLRAVCRLLRPFDAEFSQTHNGIFRDLAHGLATTRDADVMLATLHQLQGRTDSPALARTIENLAAELQAGLPTSDEGDRLEGKLEAFIGQLEPVRDGLSECDFDRLSADDLLDGFRRIYCRGNDARRRAARRTTDDTLHDWRKRAKDYWYHMRLLRDFWPGSANRLIARLKKLSDALGDDHDLAVLAAHLQQRTAEVPGELVPLLELIADERRRVQKTAFRLGRKLYARKPSRMVKAIRGGWK